MKAKLLILVIALGLLLTGAYLIWPEWFGLCETHVRSDGVEVCSSPYSTDYGFPLLYLATSFSILSLMAIFTSTRTYQRWLLFTAGYAVFVAVMLVWMPSIGAGAGGFGLTYVSAAGLAKIYAWLYGIISLLVLRISEYNERRKR